MSYQNFFQQNTKLSIFYQEFYGRIFGLPDNFGSQKAWEDFRNTIKGILEELSNSNAKKIKVLEIGVGRTSSINEELKKAYSLEITGLDISEAELKENGILDEYIVYDADNPNFKEDLEDHQNKFDLIISEMFLEHVKTPENIHTLVLHLLKPGGKVIHFYPTLFEPAFLINKLLPHRLCSKIISCVSSKRASLGVFPAYYKRCIAVNKRLQEYLESFGYKLLSSKSYYGTEYFQILFPAYFLYFHVVILASLINLKPLSAYSLIRMEKV